MELIIFQIQLKTLLCWDFSRLIMSFPLKRIFVVELSYNIRSFYSWADYWNFIMKAKDYFQNLSYYLRTFSSIFNVESIFLHSEEQLSSIFLSIAYSLFVIASLSLLYLSVTSLTILLLLAQCISRISLLFIEFHYFIMSSWLLQILSMS